MQMDAVSGRYIVHESQLEYKCRRLNCERTLIGFSGRLRLRHAPLPPEILGRSIQASVS
jgi:hypothetical protein